MMRPRRVASSRQSRKKITNDSRPSMATWQARGVVQGGRGDAEVGHWAARRADSAGVALPLVPPAATAGPLPVSRRRVRWGARSGGCQWSPPPGSNAMQCSSGREVWRCRQWQGPARQGGGGSAPHQRLTCVTLLAACRDSSRAAGKRDESATTGGTTSCSTPLPVSSLTVAVVAPGGQPRRRAALLVVSPSGSSGCEGVSEYSCHKARVRCSTGAA